MRQIAVILVIGLLGTGCSVRKYAIRQMGSALSDSAGTFASDNDPELVRAAVPFSLKLIEALLEKTPNDPALLYAAASGFTQYAYAFVHSEADELEERDRAAAAGLRDRANKLYLRARDYGLRALELKSPALRSELKADPRSAVKKFTAKEVPLLYWTALSWAGALAASRDMFMLPQIPQMEALIERALELDESYDEGALHTFMITFEMSSPTRRGDKSARAKQHFDRAMDLSKGLQAGPLVAYAENVLVPAKERETFEQMLKKALAVNVNEAPSRRLQNLIMQRRARWLLARADKLFPK
jgi:predicted anti-sigma-YlaC factor YlaD